MGAIVCLWRITPLAGRQGASIAIPKDLIKLPHDVVFHELLQLLLPLFVCGGGEGFDDMVLSLHPIALFCRMFFLHLRFRMRLISLLHKHHPFFLFPPTLFDGR